MPRDCTDPPGACPGEYDEQSQSCHLVSNIMTRKGKKTVTSLKEKKEIAKLKSELKRMKVSDKPFRTAGGRAGEQIGRLFGYGDIGRNIGKFLGSGIGAIFGSGDYQMVGQSPKYNVFLNDQIPKFSTGRYNNVVCHREFIGNITGTTAFTNNGYAIQPGVSTTFPWLSTIASGYQEYRIHGMMFQFNSLITDFVTSGAPGVVVMATSYNADAPLYTSKVDMENSEYAVAVKPTHNLAHFIECDPEQTVLSKLYTRSGAPPAGQDLRIYDLGNFQLATQGNPNQLIGELWVTYCVEFMKPVLPQANLTGDYVHILRANTSGTAMFGLIQTQIYANPLNVVITANTLTIPGGWPADSYKLEIVHNGTAVAISGSYTPTITNGTLVNGFSGNTFPVSLCPGSGSPPQISVITQFTVVDTTLPVVVTFPGTGTVPTSSQIDIYLMPMGNWSG